VLPDEVDDLGGHRPLREPAVAPLGRPTEGRLRAAAHPDGRTARLDRPGALADLLADAGPRRAVEVRVLVSEGGAEGVDRLVEQGAAAGEVEPEHLELRLDVPDADAHDDPPARDRIERGERLGHGERVAVRGDVDVAEQPGAAGDAGQPAEGRHGVPPGRAHGRGPVLGDGQVVAHGQVPEAGLVGRPCDRTQLVGAGVRLPRLDVEGALGLDGELHPVHEAPGRQDCGHI
jgi:hypothetical protein